MYLGVETTPVIAANDFGKRKALQPEHKDTIPPASQYCSLPHDKYLHDHGLHADFCYFEFTEENLVKVTSTKDRDPVDGICIYFSGI